MADFSTRLRELRIGRGLRQKDLAVALGLAQTTIANYEQKLRFPDEPTLVKIADYFEVSLDALMGRSSGDGACAIPAAGAITAVPGRRGDAAAPAAGAHAATSPPPPIAYAPLPQVTPAYAPLPHATPAHATPAGATVPHAPLSGLAGEYFSLLRERGREAARACLRDAMAKGVSIAEIYLEVLAPALHEVGRLWELGEMSVADEHEFSESTQRIMSFLLPLAPPVSRPTLRCVVLPVTGEQHVVGPRMVADFLSMAGLEARFTGGGLSIRHMREMLLAAPPDLVVFSVTLPGNVDAAADAIEAVRACRELAGTRIMVGGQAFQSPPDLWARIGADGTAPDAASASRAALQLLRERD